MMTLKGDEEFYIALIIYGGIIFAGLLVSIGLTIVVFSIRRSINRQAFKKEIYDEKERKNGQSHRGGARGKF